MPAAAVDHVLTEIDRARDEIVDFASRLVRIPTVNPPGDQYEICARVIGDEPHGPEDRTRWYTRRVVDPTVMIEALEQRQWLPAIYFIFSRAGCERAMEDVLGEGRPLITRE